MLPDARSRFTPIPANLKDGRVITVRLLEPTDDEALAEFYSTVPRDDWRFYSPHPLTREMAYKKAQDDADTETFVCTVGIDSAGLIVGYAWYRWSEPDSPTSEFGICIRREYQGSGTGQALMSRLLEVAKEYGPPGMYLTVQKANPRAFALYKKMGFYVVREQMRGQVEEFPAEPEYYMERIAHDPL